MGASLRLCSGAEAVRKFRRAGFGQWRPRGSHVMMVKSGYEYTLSIPRHEELGPGLLKKPIRQAGVTVEECNSL